MSQYGTTFDLNINVGHCDLYFMLHISWRLFDIWTPYFGIVSQYDPMFDLKIFALWAMFHGPLFSPNIFSGWTLYFGIMGQYDPTCDLQIF